MSTKDLNEVLQGEILPDDEAESYPEELAGHSSADHQTSGGNEGQVDSSNSTAAAMSAAADFEASNRDPEAELERILGEQIKEEHTECSHVPEDTTAPTELDAGPTRQAIIDKLETVDTFVRESFANQVVTFLVDGERPLLNVLGTTTDLYLVDQGAVHVTCRIDDHLRVVCALLTANRELVKEEVIVNTFEADLVPLLRDVTSYKFRACEGFLENDALCGDVFQRLRKTDIASMLVEKYNGQVIYRSRSCQFVVNSDSIIKAEHEPEVFNSHCLHCKGFLSDLDVKYMNGRLTKSSEPDMTAEIETSVEPMEEISQDESAVKRKRGRPKGSKNKLYFSTIVEEPMETSQEETGDDGKQENDDVDDEGLDNSAPVVLVREEDPDFVYGEENVAIMDDPYDQDYGKLPRRGLRKRITTKRQRALLELTKRKRGRPPLRMGPVECLDCGSSFSMLKDYRKHCMEHTNSFACDFEDCVKRFKAQKELDIHMRKHRGEKPYMCGECDKAYQTRQDLRLHIRKHTGERPYNCSGCLKRFARRSALRIHKISVHENVKSYLCPECGAAFKANSALIDHRKRVHLQIKPHQCEYCKKDFFSKKDYSEHIRTHTGEKPFQCQMCGKCFGRQNHLKRHVEGVHKNGAGINPAVVAAATAGTLLKEKVQGPVVGRPTADIKNEEDTTTTTTIILPPSMTTENGQTIGVLTSQSSSNASNTVGLVSLSNLTAFDLKALGGGEVKLMHQDGKHFLTGSELGKRAPLDFVQRSPEGDLVGVDDDDEQKPPQHILLDTGESLDLGSLHTYTTSGPSTSSTSHLPYVMTYYKTPSSQTQTQQDFPSEENLE